MSQRCRSEKSGSACSNSMRPEVWQLRVLFLTGRPSVLEVACIFKSAK